MFIIVCYDVPDDRRRNSLAHILEGYGYRVQWSVFECELTPVQFKELREKVTRVVKGDEDGVRYYFLCQDCLSKITIDGLGEVKRDKPFYVV